MNSNNQNSNTLDQDVEVLYQKLGGTWFAFSVIDNEVFMAPVTEEKINEIKREKTNPSRPFENEAA